MLPQHAGPAGTAAVMQGFILHCLVVLSGKCCMVGGVAWCLFVAVVRDSASVWLSTLSPVVYWPSWSGLTATPHQLWCNQAHFVMEGVCQQ